MRDLRLLNAYRMTGTDVVRLWGWTGDHTCGAFELPSPIDRRTLRVVVSAEGGWDHVSVSRQNRCPNWPEMEYIKRLFFRDDETAMQLHVPPSQHRSYHPNCLHLWRPNDDQQIPRPPGIFVGPGENDAPDVLPPALLAEMAQRAGRKP